MSIKSINEPEGPGRTTMVTPMSINEPFNLPEGTAELTVTSIEPSEATIGDPDIEMHVYGTGFVKGCVITFNGGPEPTTFHSSEDLSTIVRPLTATTPGTYPVTVQRGENEAGPEGFTFLAAEGATGEDTGDEDPAPEAEAGKQRRGTPSHTLPGRRKQR